MKAIAIGIGAVIGGYLSVRVVTHAMWCLLALMP